MRAVLGTLQTSTLDLKARVDAGEIGDVIVMHQTSRWSIAEDGPGSGKPGWFTDPRHVPGGALIDEGIYWIELFEWMAGSPIVRVEAQLANFVHKDIDVEDWGMATFTCANGVVATLEASWTINAPRKTGPSPKQNAVVRLEVIGTRGEIINSGSDHRDVPCCPRVRLTGSSSGSRSRASRRPSRSRSTTWSSVSTTSGRLTSPSSRRAARSAPHWRRINRRRRDERLKCTRSALL